MSESTFDLSAESQREAKKEGLGELCKVYPVLKRVTDSWMIGLTCLIFGVIWTAMSVLPIIFLSTAPSTPGSVPISTAGMLILWAVAIPGFILLIAGFYLISRRHYVHWQVSLWQNGFIYEKKQIRQVFHWKQIESVQADITHISEASGRPSPMIYTCKVRRHDGYEATLGHTFSDNSELIDVILAEAARQLGPQELSIVPPKDISTFAHLKLDRQGLSNAQETLAWHEIQEFMTKNGAVTILKKTEQACECHLDESAST